MYSAQLSPIWSSIAWPQMCMQAPRVVWGRSIWRNLWKSRCWAACEARHGFGCVGFPLDLRDICASSTNCWVKGLRRKDAPEGRPEMNRCFMLHLPPVFYYSFLFTVISCNFYLQVCLVWSFWGFQQFHCCSHFENVTQAFDGWSLPRAEDDLAEPPEPGTQ